MNYNIQFNCIIEYLLLLKCQPCCIRTSSNVREYITISDISYRNIYTIEQIQCDVRYSEMLYYTTDNCKLHK